MAGTPKARPNAQKQPDVFDESPRAYKRRKLSSETSISDASALIPTSAASNSTAASGVDSDTDASSELSESSEEPSSSEDGSDSDESEPESGAEEPGVVNLRANQGKKPAMRLPGEDELGPDIRPFLKDFLPKLQRANEELEAQKEAGTLERAEIDGEAAKEEGGEQCIEMHLGLGVLEEKRADGSDSSDSESDGEADGQKDVLRKLMGQEKMERAAGIQEVGQIEEQER